MTSKPQAADTGVSKKLRVCATHGEYQCNVISVFGLELTGGCPHCHAERAAEEKARQDAQDAYMRQIKIRERLKASAIPARFSGKLFADYTAETAGQRRALSVCTEYAENFSRHYRDGRCLLLLGKPGTGKTHLSAAIAHHLIHEAGCTAVYRTVAGLLQYIKGSYDRAADYTEAQAFKTLIGADLLIIDEIGATKATEFELATLFTVINGRYEEQRPTVIVSNLMPAELPGAIGERCVDRLREGGGIALVFDWESMRAKVRGGEA